LGVKKDYFEAVKWYRKSAEQGSADAGFRLGLCYLIGNGVPKDRDKGFELIRWAAKNDCRDAIDFVKKVEERERQSAMASNNRPLTPEERQRKRQEDNEWWEDLSKKAEIGVKIAGAVAGAAVIIQQSLKAMVAFD